MKKQAHFENVIYYANFPVEVSVIVLPCNHLFFLLNTLMTQLDEAENSRRSRADCIFFATH